LFGRALDICDRERREWQRLVGLAKAQQKEKMTVLV
jgi:hypothetical protein